MISSTDPDFWRLYQLLPKDIQKQAKETYRLFQQNPSHPGIRFKPVIKGNPSYWSVRITDDYRAVGLKDDPGEIIWFFIGTHAQYDNC